jgi:hypothetical protein
MLEGMENCHAVHAKLYPDAFTVASRLWSNLKDLDEQEQMRQLAVMFEEQIVAASVAVCAKRH